jgi:hypothetical protein
MVAIGACCVPTSDVAAQFRKGILQQKVEVTLNRKRPPKVYLMATDIAVKVTSQTPQANGLTERLAAALQAELTSRDPRLKPSQQPGTIISCAIGRVETANNWADRKVTVRKKTGERQVYDKKADKYKTEDVYSNVEEIRRVQAVTGSLAVSYQTADKSGAVLDSDAIVANYKAEFVNGDGAPTAGAVEQSLLQNAIAQIVPRLVPTVEAVKVLLGRPNDQVDDINKLGQAGLWPQMLQRLETMKPLSDAKKEAYRIFNIGVANEALGYQSNDIAAAKTMLEQAALKYSQALEMKPDEEYFRDPQTRIDTAIAAYKTLEQQQAAYAQLVKDAEEKLKRPIVAAEGSRSLSPGARKGPKPLDNADIIDLVKSGLDHPNMVATIKAAPAVQFDLSPSGLKDLLTSGVTNQLIAVMRTKQQPQAATRKPAAPSPAAKPAANSAPTPPAVEKAVAVPVKKE